MKVLNLSKLPLNNDEISVLKLELSFTPTPPQNISDLEYDLYQFSRKHNTLEIQISKPFPL